jgi:hypothetical protein
MAGEDLHTPEDWLKTLSDLVYQGKTVKTGRDEASETTSLCRQLKGPEGEKVPQSAFLYRQHSILADLKN